MIMRSPDYNNTPSEGYWSEYTNSSESSMERHKEPKHSRRAARVVEESYTRSPSMNQPEEEEEFMQETPEVALIASQAYYTAKTR
jgi:hypothetical protein